MPRKYPFSTDFRAHRWNFGDVIVVLVVLPLLLWAITPGFGPDIFSLEQRFGWRIGYKGVESRSRIDSLPRTSLTHALRALPVRSNENDKTPHYHREAFGVPWADEDHNGCDTRNDILARDLARTTFKSGTHHCVVMSGTLAEPYTGKIIDFIRGNKTSGLVQIDHVTALSDAWKSGAWKWDRATRQAFANDPLNLLAVDGKQNQDKGASRSDEWLPADKSYHCPYVARQIAVKEKWKLSVVPSEREAMAKVLESCPKQTMPTQ